MIVSDLEKALVLAFESIPEEIEQVDLLDVLELANLIESMDETFLEVVDILKESSLLDVVETPVAEYQNHRRWVVKRAGKYKSSMGIPQGVQAN